MNENLKNILTIGAHNRIKSHVSKYDSIKSDLENLYNTMESRKLIINETLVKVINAKKLALSSIKQIHKITKNLKGKEREFLVKRIEKENLDINLDKISETLNFADIIENSTKGIGGGVGAGILTSSAVPLLVGNLAVASTGTAISTLSGAAATNATLAWLGGGSLAAGGGGVALGTVVLGTITFGISIITALAFTTAFSHLSANKEINKIKAAEINALEMIDELRKNLFAFDLIEKRASELILSLNKMTSTFEIEFQRTYEKIYKIPLFSRSAKTIRKMFGFNYFSRNDIIEIAYIGAIATDFAKMIDTQVLEEPKG